MTEIDAEAMAELRAAFPALVAAAGPALGEALRRVEGAMATIPVTEVMGFLALYYLTVQAGENPEHDRADGIFQSEVELAQGLALRHARPHGDGAAFYPEGKAIIDALPQIQATLDLLEMKKGLDVGDDTARARAGVTLTLRLRERHVRGWAYADQLEAVVAELFQPIDDLVRDRQGWSPLATVQWWSAIGDELNQRIAVHRALVQEALDWPVDERWPARVRDELGLLPAPPDAELVAMARGSDEARLGFIVHSSDRRASSIYRFTLEELFALYPESIAPDPLKRLLDGWSLAPGDLAPRSANELIRDNPVLARPLVRDGGTWYFFLAPTAFGHSALVLLESVIASDAELSSAYLERRAKFLEERAARVLANALPGVELYRNIRRRDPETSKVYESDILLLLDSYAVVAECKAGRLPANARRGKGRALGEQIEELIVEPAKQARRLANALVAAEGPLELIDDNGESLVVDAGKVRQAITLGVTLEPFAELLPRLGDLSAAGLTDQAVEEATLSMPLTALEIVTDILTSPSAVLHYLARRSELERGTLLLGGELDILGCYLQTGLNVGEAEFSGTEHLHLVDASDAIDTYHYRRIAGLPAERPATRRTEWWTGVLARVEERRAPHWSEVGVAMCNVSFEDQQGFERDLLELRDGITSGRRPSGDFVHLQNGPPQRRDHFAGVVATWPDRKERLRRFEDAARVVFGTTDAERAIVIGLAPVPLPDPYVFLGVYDRPPEGPG